MSKTKSYEEFMDLYPHGGELVDSVANLSGQISANGDGLLAGLQELEQRSEEICQSHYPTVRPSRLLFKAAVAAVDLRLEARVARPEEVMDV